MKQDVITKDSLTNSLD